MPSQNEPIDITEPAEGSNTASFRERYKVPRSYKEPVSSQSVHFSQEIEEEIPETEEELKIGIY